MERHDEHEEQPYVPESVEDDPELAIERRGLLRGFFGTLRESVHPILSSGGYALGEKVAPALFFCILTFVPLALLQGIIPYTHTLSFGDGFGIVVRQGRGDVGLDVFHAMGIGLLVCSVRFVAMGVSFASLARAFGQVPAGAKDENLARVAWRAMLLRAHWIPLQGTMGLAAGLMHWALPKSASSSVAILFLALLLVAMPLVVHFVALRHAAIRSCGVSKFASLLVVLVPFVLAGVLEHILIGNGYEPGGVLEAWLPTPTPVEAP